MIVTAKEYTSAAEMRAAAAATHARLMKPKVKPEIRLLNAAPPPKVIPFMARKLPEWQAQKTYFDHHVVASRPILELLKTGQLELTVISKRPVLQIVEEVLSKHPGITMAMIKGIDRHRKVSLVRQTAMWEVKRQRPDKSLPEIGRWFGGRDHTTVIHAIKKIEAMRASS